MTLNPLLLSALFFTFFSCSSDPSLIEREALTRACVSSAACGVQQRPSVEVCVDFYFNVQVPSGLGRTTSELYRCVLEAQGDCERVRGCFGPDESCDQSYQGHCEGARAFSCDLLDKRVYGVDCGRSGLSCSEGIHSFAAECRCDDDFARCEGGWALRCSGGQVQSEHCAAEGKGCEEGRCVAPSNAPACEPKSARCEGDTLLRCDGQIELHVNCSALPIPHSCHEGSCVPRNDECDDDFNRCAAERALEACLLGRWERFDCGALGFESCLVQPYGANCI
ncbi:MAG: hypothetical protein JRH20_20995 [Deltaproteobacteria bacterium]|nr:hypothetical protein [Deltaproteobacteria bacterium]